MDKSSVFTNRLTNGQSVSLTALEVLSIPHCSIISNDEPKQVMEEYKNSMSGLLNGIYQIYYSLSVSENRLQDISLELLWTTTKVQNQPYHARIRFFVIARSIHEKLESSQECTSAVMNLIDQELKIQKYETAFLSENDLHDITKSICNTRVKSIIKEERVEDLQNSLMNSCYGYDRLPTEIDDFSKLIHTLTEYPNCAVSFQLIPTMFTPNEAVAVSTTLQSLETLSKGVLDVGGMVSVVGAQRYVETYRYYSEHKTAPMFAYNILVFADDTAMSSISGRLHAQLSNSSTYTTNLKWIDLEEDEVNIINNFYPLPWAINEVILGKDRDMQLWSSGSFTIDFYRLPYIITCEEAVTFFRLPIGSNRISAGVYVNESEKGNKAYAENIVNAGDILVGTLRSTIKNDTIGFSLNDLTKHMLITGTPGSGKTTFSVGLLDRIWKEHHIPFLVIEPAKNEYRALVQSIPNLQIFTPGKNFISPFVYNPFVPPKNVKLEAYKSTLKTAFSAAVSMQSPLDKIFEETVNNCYSDFRWLDTYTSADGGNVFNITDFIDCFNRTFEDIGYTGDAKNIGRAGNVRLKSLVSLFDNYFSIPIEDLLSKPTIIELSAIENAEQKALIIALLLLSILSYVNANYVGDGGLRNVVLLEEAHVLLDSKATGEDADPSAIAQELIKRMLAEIRSYGVGLIIADQSPRKVSADVVALTDMKVTFRLVESTDKQMIADSTNMTDAQVQRLTRLRPGEAFLFFNKLSEPEEVIIDNYRLENNINITISDDSVASLSTYWEDKKDKLRPYPQCLCIKYCNLNCDYARRILSKEIARRIFARNFKSDSTDFGIVKKVFSQISKLVRAELNHESFTPELLLCVKVHLWRKIKYDTKIPIKESLIKNSLNK